MEKTPMLRHTKTGELYPYNQYLAKHPDVEVVDDSLPAPEEVVLDVAPKARKPRKKAEPEVVTEPDVDVSDLDLGYDE